MQCPNCGGDMWDNRGRKTNPKAPDFRCKDKDCLDPKTGMQSAVWLPKPKGAAPQAGARGKESIHREMLVSYEKDLMESAVEMVKAEMAAGIVPPKVEVRILVIFRALQAEFRQMVVPKYIPELKPKPVTPPTQSPDEEPPFNEEEPPFNEPDPFEPQ